MIKRLPFCILIIVSVASFAQNPIEWVSTSPTQVWQTASIHAEPSMIGAVDAEIIINKPLQTIEGFGACFNELGWVSLNLLPKMDLEAIMKELFAPGTGANFSICRMPVGANDFSRKWYSYNETPMDFEMKNFSIQNDMETLVPFIKKAQKYNPGLKIWASPWSPPSWMKYNHHFAARSLMGNSNFSSEEYGMDFTNINNGLKPENEGREGTNMFIQEEKYFKAYALYFSKFIESYKIQQIPISMVMPQNEFNSAQVFPSCTWTAAGLTRFLTYLVPQMQTNNKLVFFGTMERANYKLVDTILSDVRIGKEIKGVGFQWAGKGAIETIHKRYPHVALYQTEQECGNGKNDWKYCLYAWGLLKHYFKNGANAYQYWNISLKQGGISTWGWKQNSLISVDTAKRTFTYNYEYYLIKHLSHFVNPGAKFLPVTGSFDNLLAFKNPDNSIVIVACNEEDKVRKLVIKVANKTIQAPLKPNTFNTFLIRQSINL